jgi:hypothetical protein
MSEELRGLPKQADQAIALINELHTERLQYSEYTLLIEAAMSLALYETHVPALLEDNARLQSELAAMRERAEAAEEDLKHCMYFANPKNNNTCNFCEKDTENGGCQGRTNWIHCSPKWRGAQKKGAEDKC